MSDIVERLNEEEGRMVRLRDCANDFRDKHYGTDAAFDFNTLKHAISGRDPVLTEAAAEIARLRADLAQLEQESDAEIALLRDYLASAERHRAEEMEERHRLAREVIRLRADLAAAQEREQRMREALETARGLYQVTHIHAAIDAALGELQ